MATDQYTLERIRSILDEKKVKWIEKRMFGGDCFMVNDKMCFGTYKGGLMARIEPEDVSKLSRRKHAEQMIHAGRPMKGYMFVEAEGFDTDKQLEFWIQQCLDFNPKAKSSKK